MTLDLNGHKSNRGKGSFDMERRSVLKAVLSATGLVTFQASLGTLRPLFAEKADKNSHNAISPLLRSLHSPVLFAGDETTAYRDPAAIYHHGSFYLYFTFIRLEERETYSYVAWSKSRDLQQWTEPKIITPRDKSLEFSSPGDVVWTEDGWVLCLQTYPRPNGERYGNKNSRVWTMHSQDLEHWSTPELLRVKGPDVSERDMGRMIDPYILKDKDVPGKWWCFYKQNGISMSYSWDLSTWTYAGRTSAGENPCVIVDKGDYVLFHSPANGIGMKRSNDLVNWRDDGLLTLGQKDWPWAYGRLTGGFVLDLRSEPWVGRALMFFHGSQFPEEDPRGGFNNFASIGVAWSGDLHEWFWPAS
jgi:hypothetical protein